MRSGGSRTFSRALFLGVVCVGGMWIALGDQMRASDWAALPEWARPPEWAVTEMANAAKTIRTAAFDFAREMTAARTPEPQQAAVPPEPAPLPMLPPEPPAPGGAPQTETASASAPLTTGSLPAAAEAYEAPKPEPLTPPVADPADPNQKRALTAGLHPGLSRVLLAGMTDTDYKNAAYAIKTALAKTANDEIFIWPRQRRPDQALFHVRFVQGAAADCRRYVVTVTKDGWLTTALPMETCGLKPVIASSRP